MAACVRRLTDSEICCSVRRLEQVTMLQGHCVRLAISGSDTKHFSCDRACYGSRSIGIHSSLEQTSMLRLP